MVIGLAVAMFAIAALTLVTGGTTLITIPLMVAFGIAPKTAIATATAMQMMMSAGGTLGFLRGDLIDGSKALRLATISAAGAALGAMLLLSVPDVVVEVLVLTAMIGVLAFILSRKHDLARAVSPARQNAGYAAAFALGVYAGMLRGGYGTLLTALCSAFFGLGILQAVATSRAVNFAASLVATGVFAARHLVDWKIALWMGGASMAGALIAAKVTRLIPERWLKLLFVLGVACLAVKSILDVIRSIR